MPQHPSSREHTLAHSVSQDKIVSASFIVLPHAHSHLVSLMSLLNAKFTPFPSLLSSPSASSSRAPTPLLGRTRSWCQSPDAPARWRESGRLVDSAPNTLASGCIVGGLFSKRTLPPTHGLLFFVPRKDKKMRLIFDTREANAHFSEPPQTSLAGAEALSSIRVPSGARWPKPVSRWISTGAPRRATFGKSHSPQPGKPVAFPGLNHSSARHWDVQCHSSDFAVHSWRFFAHGHLFASRCQHKATRMWPSVRRD